MVMDLMLLLVNLAVVVLKLLMKFFLIPLMVVFQLLVNMVVVVVEYPDIFMVKVMVVMVH